MEVEEGFPEEIEAQMKILSQEFVLSHPLHFFYFTPIEKLISFIILLLLDYQQKDKIEIPLLYLKIE